MCGFFEKKLARIHVLCKPFSLSRVYKSLCLVGKIVNNYTMFKASGYQIVEQLYESSRSLVYRAVRMSDKLPVVLKLLNREYPTPEELARFRREYGITHKLGDIDGVIQVYGLETHQRSLFMVLEDFGANALNRHIEKGGALNLPTFLRLAIRIAYILSVLHQRHVMHKDLNPSNFVWNSETDTLKLIDFGISTELSREQPEIRHPSVLEGTLAYISPEQTGRMNRAIDYRSDLYSLGASFYHLLTGHPPFQAEDALEMVHCHLAKMPAPLDNIPLRGGDGVGSMPASPFPCPSGKTPPPAPSLGKRGGEISPGPPFDKGGEKPPSLLKRRGLGDEFPKALSDIIMKLMAKNAEERYQSAYGLKLDLEFCLENQTGLGDLSGFVPGQHDFSERFEIPQKLYGRERESAVLLASFNRAASGTRSEMLLVHGYAGVGKSALVNELQKAIVAKRGFFLSGKFDQHQRNIPYSAFIQAFQGFIRHVLSEPETRLHYWKEKLTGALDPNAQVLTAVIPELEMILGPQPGLPELSAEQAHNRFKLVLRIFVETCAAAEHPLVFFLDDLQWADSPSLHFLQYLLTDSALRFTLFIGAYRDREIHAGHPLSLTIDELQGSDITLHDVALSPLTHDAVGALLTDTLHLSKIPQPVLLKEENALAELLLRKTGGNPFFLRQFLQSLYEEQLLTLNRHSKNWEWDWEGIQQRELTENVIDLMIHKIENLPAATRRVVQLAACIGGQFDLHMLAIVCEQSDTDTLNDLWEALQAELILPRDDAYKYIADTKPALRPKEYLRAQPAQFKFLHDRVQQAAYALIDAAHKQATHLQIGRLLLANTPQAQQEEILFEIVTHFNAASALLDGRAEQTRLAILNLRAAQKAKLSAAYPPALEYARAGIALLAGDDWHDKHETAFALHIEAAEAAYLTGNFDDMECWTRIAGEHACTLLEKTAIAEIRIAAYRSQHKLLEAIACGRSILQVLGVRLPTQVTTAHIFWGTLRTNIRLLGKPVERLSELPEMTDPEKQAAIRILSQLSAAAFSVQPKLLPLIIFAGMRLIIRYGNTPQSAFVYAGYALFLCGVLGDIKTGYRFGQLAVNILDTFPAKRFIPSTLVTVHTFVTHWKTHLRETFTPLFNAYQCGLEVGDLEYSALAAYMHCNHSYLAGEPLPELDRRFSLYDEAIARLQQPAVSVYLKIDHQLIRNLMGEYSDAPGSLSWDLGGDIYSEAQMLPRHIEANDRSALLTLYCSKLVLRYSFERYPQARKAARKAEKYLDAGMSMYIVPLLYFFDALSRLALCPELSRDEKRRELKQVAACHKKLSAWARHAPMNYLHKCCLLEAELARVRGKRIRAIEAYDRAIALTREHEYLHEEALACELTAKFYLDYRQENIAGTYLREARHAYHKWGALAKIQHLEKRYPRLLTVSEQPSRGDKTAFHLTSNSTELHDRRSGALDLATVLKASQTISREIDYDTLLTRLLVIMIENAGAERGMLLGKDEGRWVVKASRLSEEDETVSETLPENILVYAARTLAPVVLHDAAREGQFTHDPYIRSHQSKSVLCLPFINQSKPAVILFLENNKAPGVFSPERLEILKLLASQAAISIENAGLYANLEWRVEKRTAELTAAKEAAQKAQRAAETANQAKSEFLSNMSHELRTPLNAILGYTHILKRGTSPTENEHKHLEIIERSGTLLLNLINELLDLSRIEAQKLDLHEEMFSLQECVRSVTSMIEMRAKEKGVRFESILDSDLPSSVIGDEHRLSQILLNLLGNAVKFTDKGEVKLKLTNVKSTKPDSQATTLKFEISDTGPGIPSHRLEEIFSPFAQVGDHTRKRKGTGLGLAISRRLVRLMGGELFVDSQEKEGSHFWFELPLALPETAKIPPPEHTQANLRVVGYRGEPKSILVVDDNLQNRCMLAALLSSLGFAVQEATNGKDALEQLALLQQSRLPDLILLDLIMPVMNGFELAHQLRSSPDFKQIKVVIVSANVNLLIEEQLSQQEYDDFLPKPIHFQQLLTSIAKHLSLEWVYESASQPVLNPTSLIFPPQNDLEAILQAAKGGYITDIRKVLDRLKTSDTNFGPFVLKIDSMAKAFQFRQIIEFISSELNREMKS